MDDFSSISLLSLAMLVGCYVAGTIPLAVNFSEVSPRHTELKVLVRSLNTLANFDSDHFFICKKGEKFVFD